MSQPDVMEKLVSLCKRRGFIFQSSEIYGGTGSVWDYGPLGVELKKNLKDRWWFSMVRARDDIEGLDAAILMHPRVWEASGHVAGFTDPLIDCRNCKKRFRADDPKIKGTPGHPDAQCPACGMRGTLSEPRLFNLMFKTFMGPVEESAHYARAAFDIQFDFGGTLGPQEIEGVHHRGDFDLSRHQEFSGKKLEYFDQPTNRRFVPFVVETSVGADRTTLAVLVNAYREESVEGEEEGRTVLRLAPALAPVKAGIFPLVKKDGMPGYAGKLASHLPPRFPVFYDESGAIGRRYRRQDEIGTPFCITIDGQTLADNTVTIRDRDTLLQERVASDRVRDIVAGRVAG